MMNNLKFLIISLFCVLFSIFLNAQTVNQNDILKPLNLPKELKIDTIFLSKKQSVLKNEELKKRESFYLGYTYNGHRGTLKFFIYDDKSYEVQQYEYLWLKCLEKLDTLYFDIDFFLEEIKSKTTGVKKVRFYKNLSGNWLQSTKNKKCATELKHQEKGIYNDALIGKKNIPFNLHLELFIYDLPILQKVSFDSIYGDLNSFTNYYESNKDRVWLFYNFEYLNNAKKTQSRRILINPLTSEIISDSYSITDKITLW